VSSGTLSMNGASGSGTNHLTVSTETSSNQINADLASLTYEPASGTGADAIKLTADAPTATGKVESTRYIPIAVTGGGPALNEPSSETVAPSATVAVSGSYSDSFAQGNPGALFLGISDNSGTLSATDASGNAVAGSGSNSIALNTDYVDLNAILASLHYTAPGSAGSDTIHFDVWNQAGTETTGNTAITIGSGSFSAAANQASTTMAANFTTTSPSSGSLLPTDTTGSNSLSMIDPSQPVVVPLLPS
jgi:hypothetical protein